MIQPPAVDALISALRQLPGFEDAVLAGPLEAMRGGYWAAIYRLRLDGVADDRADLVLRVMPADDIAAKENAIQRGVAAQGFPAPAVWLTGGRDRGLGGPFVVMSRVPGQTLLAGLDGLAAVRRLPFVLRAMPACLADAMASLHDLDPQPILAALRAASTSAPTGTDAVLEQLSNGAADSRDGQLEASAAWLRAHRPTDGSFVVCHGDLHPFNVLVVGDAWSVIDWTAAVVADPAYDLTFTSLLLSHPPLHAPAPLRPFIAAAGRRITRRFVARYRSRSNHRPDPITLEWYTTLHSLRIALDLARWRRDGTITERHGHPWLALEPVVRERLSGNIDRSRNVQS